MLLSVSQLQKHFSEQVVLDGITFHIDQKDKIAIVGSNGAGKSTLLNILAGNLDSDGGAISYIGNVKRGFLTQNPVFDPALTVREVLSQVFSDLKALENEIRELEKAMNENSDEALFNRYDTLTHTFAERGGYSVDSRINGVLNGLGFTEDKPVRVLSGGEKTRLALGKLLLEEPDLLLLDEPTNHLDIAAMTWLESYLKTYPKAILFVSHDRYLIDQIAGSILAIEHGKSVMYKGGYAHYLEEKNKNREIAEKHYQDQQKIIKKQEESIAKLRSFNREKQIRRAKSKEKQLAKMTKVTRPENDDDAMRLTFAPRLTPGKEILKIKDLAMSYDDRVLFEHVNLDIFRADRVALIGPNGIGKSTLLKIIMREITPIKGTIVYGQNVETGYYDQLHESLDFSKTIFDEVHDEYPKMTHTEVRNALGAFLFKGEDVFKTIGQLSGGERSRVVLCKLLLKKANFLLLDEPTNHLDITGKEILEDALEDFSGTMLFVSHDRYFINKIATRIWAFDGHHWQDFPGNYDDYLAATQIKAPPPVKRPAPKADREKRKISRELEAIEQELTRLTALRDENEEDYEKYNQYDDEIRALEKKWEDLMETYERMPS